MPKIKDGGRNRPTHFEQIPLEVVKKIAEEDVPKSSNTATDDGSAEPIPKKKAVQGARKITGTDVEPRVRPYSTTVRLIESNWGSSLE